jgi:hypothetical protein
MSKEEWPPINADEAGSQQRIATGRLSVFIGTRLRFKSAFRTAC